MSGTRLLLVDDDPDDCYILTDIIGEITPNVDLTCLNSCDRLLKFLISSERPDMILLDLNMPVISGHSCLKRIKSNPRFQNVPVIIYSTASREEIISECYAAGASLYIVKPTNAAKLKELICGAIDTFVGESRKW